MKKIVMMGLVAVTCNCWAALETREWNFKFIPVTTLSTPAGHFTGLADGDGFGWYASVSNVTTGATYDLLDNGGSPSLGYNSGLDGFLVNDAVFGNATDLDTVVFYLYDNALKSSAGWVISSLPYQLQDAPAIAGPGDTDVTFNMGANTWQAIPEPATFLLFAVGGMGAWMIRRNKLQVKEDADV